MYVKSGMSCLSLCMLLLCIWHIEENIKRNFLNKIPDPKKNEIMKMIFGNNIEKGLVDCQSIEEFEQKLSQFHEYVSLDNLGSILRNTTKTLSSTML